MYDVKIENVQIVDGTGLSPYQAEVGISGADIAIIGARVGEAERVIDGGGMVLAPGFIDIHTHSEFCLFIDHRAESKVRQGVTTEIVGNCGGWVGPLKGKSLQIAQKRLEDLGYVGEIPWSTLAEYIETMQAEGVSINVGTLVGHGTVRAAVMGYEDREPTNSELQQMKHHVEESMQAGAFGMSTGIYYAPGSYSGTDELVALSEVVRDYGGIHSTHIRDESNYNIGLTASIEEVLEIARKSWVSLQISHLKALGPGVWGSSGELLEMIESAASEGLDVSADQYPYRASGSSITGALIPRWAQAGGREEMLKRIDDPQSREKLYQQVEENLRRRGGAESLMIAGYPPEREYEGLRLSEVAEQVDSTPVQTALDLLRRADASFVSFVMDEEDVETIMQGDRVMVGSDGRAVAACGQLSKGHPHPRYFGTFPRVLGHYRRDRGVVSLQEAVRKMTSMPAEKLGLTDRGVIREGGRADLVLFDPDTVEDRATFENPKQCPVGIEMVMVNGQIVIDDEKHTGACAGEVLRRN